MEIELDDMQIDALLEDEVYFDDDKQEILTIARGAGGDLWKEERIRCEKEYFRRKLKGK